MKFADIRDRLVMHWPMDAREDLRDTLDALAQLEADFATVCREVAILSTDYTSKRYSTTREFDRVLDDRGIVIPDIL